jgi:hypothetical protein
MAHVGMDPSGPTHLKRRPEMRRGAFGALLCAAAIAGCAGSPSYQQEHKLAPAQTLPLPARTPEAGQPSAPNESADNSVEHLFADPRLDPIRDKVPLVLRTGAVTPQLLSNQDKPTPAEKQAIKVWMSVREQAQQVQLEQRGPPSQRLVRTRQLVTRAILQLYNGDLTYGQFAKRIQELDSEYQAAARRVPR